MDKHLTATLAAAHPHSFIGHGFYFTGKEMSFVLAVVIVLIVAGGIRFITRIS